MNNGVQSQSVCTGTVKNESERARELKFNYVSIILQFGERLQSTHNTCEQRAQQNNTYIIIDETSSRMPCDKEQQLSGKDTENQILMDRIAVCLHSTQQGERNNHTEQNWQRHGES